MYMRKIAASKFPSMTSLRCFETAARHLSFTHAAKELYMTQSAVGKQVALLESILDCNLFIRHKQRLELTPIGERFFHDTQDALNKVEESVLNVLAHSHAMATLKIVSHPTFCARWLIPALKGFSKANPNIHLDVHDQVGDFIHTDASELDVGFLHGHGVWPGMASIKLFDSHFVAVCTPELNPLPMSDPNCIDSVTLIQSRIRPHGWLDYFASANMSWEGVFAGPRFDSFYDVVHAAISGCGVALVPDIFVKEELQTGKLKLAWSHMLERNGAYYMVHPSNKSDVPHVKTLIEWIKQRF